MLKRSQGGLSAVVGVRTGPDNQMAQDVYSSGLYIQGSNASTEFVVDGGNEKVPVLLLSFPLSLLSILCLLSSNGEIQKSGLLHATRVVSNLSEYRGVCGSCKGSLSLATP